MGDKTQKYRFHRRLLAMALGLALLPPLGIGSISPNTVGEAIQELPAGAQKNPLWHRYEKVAERYNLDLGFARQVIVQKKMISSHKNILCRAPKSVDVILFGDSSLAWGTIPQVIEQVAGLKVAVVANRSMYLNVRTLKVLERLRKHYLKPGGITVYSYDNWTQRINPKRISTRHLLPIEEMTNAEFVAYADARRRACVGGPRPGVVLGEPGFRWNALEPKEIPTDQESEPVLNSANASGYTANKAFANMSGVNETNTDANTDIIEGPTPAPLSAMQLISWKRLRALDSALQSSRLPSPRRRYKDIYMYPGITWLRWDSRSVTMFRPKNYRYSVADSRRKPAPFYSINYSQKTNAKFFRSLKGRKVLMTPIFTYDRDYRTARYYYKILYRGSGIEFANLGAMHPPGESYPIDQYSHILNEGGLVKSVLIGQWLKNHY